MLSFRVLNGGVITVLHRKHMVCVISVSVNEDPICTHQYKSRQLELARKFIFLFDSDFSGLLSLASHLPKVQLPLAFSDITLVFKDCLNEVPCITWDRRTGTVHFLGQHYPFYSCPSWLRYVLPFCLCSEKMDSVRF